MSDSEKREEIKRKVLKQMEYYLEGDSDVRKDIASRAKNALNDLSSMHNPDHVEEYITICAHYFFVLGYEAGIRDQLTGVYEENDG